MSKNSAGGDICDSLDGCVLRRLTLRPEQISSCEDVRSMLSDARGGETDLDMNDGREEDEAWTS